MAEQQPKSEPAVDQKAPLRSPTAAIEARVLEVLLPKVPLWLEGYHLTLMTILWTAGLIVFGWLAGRGSLHWPWLSSFMLFLQWLTDSLDGKLGKMRNTAIPKWGYYADHLLDFAFMTAIYVGYAFLVPVGGQYLLFLLAFLYAVLMVSSFLSLSCLNEFQITYLGVGPTEIRLLFIIFNTLIILFGPGLLEKILPTLVTVFAVGTLVIVYMTQRRIWALDMEIKRKAERENPTD